MTRVPTPAECGLPPKFANWRPPQAEALRRLLASPKRVKALAAPTGFGKTPVYVAYALLSQQPTAIVTESRGLQDQLLTDFSSVGLTDLRGRANYPCSMRSDYTCEEGYAAKCQWKGTVHCPSSSAEMQAASSMLIVTNYAKWTAMRKFGTGVQHIQQAIFDEGHTAPDALGKTMQVILQPHEIEDVLGVEFPPSSEVAEMVNWKPWASTMRAIAEEKFIEARQQLVSSPTKGTLARTVNHLKSLSRRLAILATATPENWVVDNLGDKGFQFDPIRPGAYAESAMLMRLPSIVVVSGTLRPKSLFLLGIAHAITDFQEYASDFPRARCPIYYLPTLRVDRRTTNYSPLWTKLDQWIAPRQDRKGIVHTISFTRRDDVLAASRYAGHMLINERGEASTDTIAVFKASPAGTILVSPSVGAGYDFPGDQCEWQFICKIPFEQTTNIIRARQADDPEYGPFQAINKLVQIFGRPMRSKTDQAESIIVDSHMDWFWPRYQHLAPPDVRERLRVVTTLPRPLPKL